MTILTWIREKKNNLQNSPEFPDFLNIGCKYISPTLTSVLLPEWSRSLSPATLPNSWFAAQLLLKTLSYSLTYKLTDHEIWIHISGYHFLRCLCQNYNLRNNLQCKSREDSYFLSQHSKQTKEKEGHAGGWHTLPSPALSMALCLLGSIELWAVSKYSEERENRESQDKCFPLSLAELLQAIHQDYYMIS
jgi:hypothetical protein